MKRTSGHAIEAGIRTDTKRELTCNCVASLHSCDGVLLLGGCWALEVDGVLLLGGCWALEVETEVIYRESKGGGGEHIRHPKTLLIRGFF